MIAQGARDGNVSLFSVDLAEGISDLRRLAHACTCHHDSPGEGKTEYIDRPALADALREYGDSRAAYRLEHCGEGGLGWVGICSDDPGHDRVYVPFWCELRVCPECARRRSRQLAAELTQPIIDFVSTVPGWRGYRLRHVTLTTRVSLDEDTAEVARKLRAWRKGIRVMFQEHWPDDPYLGGLIAAEFGEAGRKLHFHALVFSRFIKRDWLGEAWQSLTDGDGRIYWVSEVKQDEIHEGVLEVCKYATKPAAFEGEDLEQTLARLHVTLKGIRRVQSFGSFYNLKRVKSPDMVCKTCGAVLDWLPELAVLKDEQSPEFEAAEGERLNLIHPNNLGGRAPPSAANNLVQLPGL